MNGIVGASFYMAAGAAISAQVRGTKQVSVAFFGDGAAASPYYFSAIRSCANMETPVIFVNENNLQYMGVPMAFTVPTKYVSESREGLDIPHFLVDGNDMPPCTPRPGKRWRGRVPAKAEHDRGDHLPVVRPLGVRRQPCRSGGGDGPAYRTDDEVKQWMYAIRCSDTRSG